MHLGAGSARATILSALLALVGAAHAQQGLAPVIKAPPDYQWQQENAAGAVIGVGYPSYYDNDSDWHQIVVTVSVNDDPQAIGYPYVCALVPGVNQIHWKATDPEGNSGYAEQVITVVDTRPPDLVPPPDEVVEEYGLTRDGLTPVLLGTYQLSDTVDPNPSIWHDQPVDPVYGCPWFPRGTTVVTWTARDAAGNTATATQRITVVARGPALGVATSASCLWSPNRQMVDVGLQLALNGAKDIEVSVTQDEPVAGKGPDASVAIDANGLPCRLWLRAARSGQRSGRVYLIIASGIDAWGNPVSAACAVVVPKSSSAKDKAAVAARAAAAVAAGIPLAFSSTLD